VRHDNRDTRSTRLRSSCGRVSAVSFSRSEGGKFESFQSPGNQYEIDQMKSVPYASTVRSLMYTQVCTHPDLAFMTRMLSRYQKNLGIKL
jgi:hypothetical protein